MSDNKDLRKSLSKLTEIVKELKKADFGNTGQDKPSQPSPSSYTDKWGKLKGQSNASKNIPLKNSEDKSYGLSAPDSYYKRKPSEIKANETIPGSTGKNVGPTMQKADQDGHATIGNSMKTTKPMATAKPPTMPIAKISFGKPPFDNSRLPGMQQDPNKILKKPAKQGEDRNPPFSGPFIPKNTPIAKEGSSYDPGRYNKPSAPNISKANVPAPGKSIPAAKTSVPAAKTTIPVKNIKFNPAKEKAYMKVQKSIVLVQKQIDPATFKPMTDNQVIKSFGMIPDIMKNVDNRPHSGWWDRGIQRASNFTNNPAAYCGLIWYGPDISKSTPWNEENYVPMNEQPKRDEEDDGDNESLKKWVSGALEGGGMNSLKGHPRAGNAIKNAATYIGKSVLGKSSNIFKSGIGDIDPEEIGSIVLDAIDEIVTASQDDKLQKAWAGTAAGLMTKSWDKDLNMDLPEGPYDKTWQDAGIDPIAEHKKQPGHQPFTPVNKSVAEPLSSKNNPQKRKSKLGDEYDGESAISGDGAKLNTKDLLDKNETIKEN